MLNIQSKVKELRDLSQKMLIVGKLQEINEQLLKSYEIRVAGYAIRPLLVEAYYYDRNRFPDPSIHAANENEKIWEKQSDRFGHLYVHKVGRGGIDLVLSDSAEYCLSILIKNAEVRKEGDLEGTFYSQVTLKRLLCDGVESNRLESEKVLFPRENQNQNTMIWHTIRKNTVQGDYAQCALASFYLEDLKKHSKMAESLQEGKEKIVQAYLKEKCLGQSREMWEELAGEYAGSKMPMFMNEVFKD